MFPLVGVSSRGCFLSWGGSFFNNSVTLSCLYAKFHWLISHVQLSFQPLSVNVLYRLADTRGVHCGVCAGLIHTVTNGPPRRGAVQFDLSKKRGPSTLTKKRGPSTLTNLLSYISYQQWSNLLSYISHQQWSNLPELYFVSTVVKPPELYFVSTVVKPTELYFVSTVVKPPELYFVSTEAQFL